MREEKEKMNQGKEGEDGVVWSQVDKEEFGNKDFRVCKRNVNEEKREIENQKKGGKK